MTRVADALASVSLIAADLFALVMLVALTGLCIYDAGARWGLW